MLTELRVLEKCRFPNILALYGVSVDNAHKPCIVYEFMPGGSLDDRLKRKASCVSVFISISIYHLTSNLSKKQIFFQLLKHDNILNLCIVNLSCHFFAESQDSYASMPPLTWHQRASIARGTARGLNYLHTIQENQPLVHGDVKPANILLDGNLQPKLGNRFREL